MLFQTAGIQIDFWVPPLVAFGISFSTSMGGISGAFLLLPLQVSVLGYTHPSVSATNQLFNVVAIPSGAYRYWKEGRMVWPLALVVAGTLPGVFIGALLRVAWLPDPARFKIFAAGVLLLVGLKMVRDLLRKNGASGAERQLTARVRRRRAGKEDPGENAGKRLERIRSTHFTLRHFGYTFGGQTFDISLWGILALSFVVGIVGGTYGIGGGAIIAPFFVTVFGLPVHTVAGAALMGTFGRGGLLPGHGPVLSPPVGGPGLAAGVLVRRGRDGGDVPRSPLPEVRPGQDHQMDAGHDHHRHRRQVWSRILPLTLFF